VTLLPATPVAAPLLGVAREPEGPALRQSWAAGGDVRWLPRERLDGLIATLRRDGRTVIGPQVVDGAIAFERIERVDELPFGWRVTSEPGLVRLTHATDGGAGGRAFDHGPAWSGIKPWTFPPRVQALAADRTGDGAVGVTETALPEGNGRLAVIGARACDLAALGIHDRVLIGGAAIDADYAARRADLLIVAVECAIAAPTCFCPTMQTGPEVQAGADVVLSELDDGFLARAATRAGEALLASLGLAPADPVERRRADAQVAAVRASMPALPAVEGARQTLLASLDSPRWDEIAARCLACGNCTLACPTCFCTGLTVASDLDGQHSTATRTWDSCFTAGFAQVAGGSFRPRQRDRYRQWLTHKFSSWWDQFGSSGCVGCGRCIAWCPVGIDVRDEIAGFAAEASAGAAAASAGTAAATAGTTATATVAGAEISPPTGPQARSTDPLRTSYVATRLVATTPETADTVTLRLATDDPGLLAAKPGQFVMVAVPAFAIPPISISRFHPDGLELTIRGAGPSTSFLTHLPVGAELALRGPLGRPWPIEDAYGRGVALVAGGIGLAPLRGVLDAFIAERERFGLIRIYIGARTPQDRLFAREIEELASREDLFVRTTVDRAGPEWLGRVGIVTQLFAGAKGRGDDVTAFVCGPERMMTAVADTLADLGVPPEHTWLTLERRMECGVGLCGHCQLGGRFVCHDGPVFSIAELGADLRREGR
jgi:NAD(P)H-flavin reductase